VILCCFSFLVVAGCSKTSDQPQEQLKIVRLTLGTELDSQDPTRATNVTSCSLKVAYSSCLIWNKGL
jgi:hypothetical protein